MNVLYCRACDDNKIKMISLFISGVINTTMNNSSVVLMMVILLASHASGSPIITFSWDTPRHFCGSQLANVLALICSHGYNFHPASDG